MCCCCILCCKQKTAYEMRISDWSSDVCSSDLGQILGSGRYCLQFALDSLGLAAVICYWTTVTARRFWLQQEMSLQIATGRSLPKDWLVMRPLLTPCDTSSFPTTEARRWPSSILLSRAPRPAACPSAITRYVWYWLHKADFVYGVGMGLELWM